MSHELNLNASPAEAASPVSFAKAGSVGLIVGLIGSLACIGGFAADREHFLQSYLFGWIVLASMVLGCLGLTLLHHIMRGQWSLSVLRLWEAGGGPAALGLLGITSIPVLLGMGTIYHHWMHPEPGDEVLAHKAGYLNPSFFILRLVFYFAAWIILATILRRSTLKQDQNNDPRETALRTNVSSGGMVLFFLTCTFAVTDWVMSLDPHWFSSLYGVWFIINQGLFAVALGTIVVTGFAKFEPYRSIISPKLTKDLGNMLFVFTMLWAYATLSQYLIIYSGNLPEFITYYTARRETWFNFLGAFNILFSFFLPWMLLLFPRWKAKPDLLLRVAILILAMRLIDLFWNIIPFFRSDLPPLWTDFAVVLALGGWWLWVFATQSAKASLIPQYDDRLQVKEATHVHA